MTLPATTDREKDGFLVHEVDSSFRKGKTQIDFRVQNRVKEWA